MLNSNQVENLREFQKHFAELVNDIQDDIVIVTDADETLSTEDTSQIFWKTHFGEQSWFDFKLGFDQVGRNYDGYSRAAHTYSAINKLEYNHYCEQSSKLVKLRYGWDDFIRSLTSVIVVTSGIKLLWQNVINLKCWSHVCLVGGNHASYDKYIVDPSIKLEVVKNLHALGKKVIAFGDSRIDSLMLKESDLGIVVVNARQSPGLVEDLSEFTHIYQLQCEEEKLSILPLLTFEELIKKYTAGML